MKTNEEAKIIYNDIKQLDTNVTYYYKLGVINNNQWALVFALDDKPQLVGKVAYQPTNSLMQEYDIDWIMPYDEDTGEVDDTEEIITGSDDVFRLYRQWLRIRDYVVNDSKT